VSERPDCEMCGQGSHRYSTSDPEHPYSATACINMLRPALDEATAENAALVAGIRAALPLLDPATPRHTIDCECGPCRFRLILSPLVAPSEGETTSESMVGVHGEHGYHERVVVPADPAAVMAIRWAFDVTAPEFDPLFDTPPTPGAPSEGEGAGT